MQFFDQGERHRPRLIRASDRLRGATAGSVEQFVNSRDTDRPDRRS
jgi:hypothetical protein